MTIKTLQQTLSHFLFAFLIVFILFPAHVFALCSIDSAGTYIEAEDFTGSYNLDGTPNTDDYFEVIDEPGANGGKALVAGDNGSTNYPPNKDVKVYEVTFPVTGTYEIWMRGRGINNSTDSMFFMVDADSDNTNDVWKAWNLGGIYNTFVWTDSMQVDPPNTFEILTAGTHRIKIAMREKESVIDGFYITLGAETPTDATVPSTVTSVSPKNGCSGPSWTVAPANLGPTCFVGYNAASTSFTITNTGNMDDATTATVTSDQPWMTLPDPIIPALNQNDSHTVTVNFNTAARSAGTHNAVLSITGGANNAPVTIAVTLLVKSIPSTAACGEIPLYAENLINPAIMVQLDTSGSMDDNMSFIDENDDTANMSRINIAEDVLKEVFLDRSIAWGFATWAGGSGNASDSQNSPTYYTNYRVGIHEHNTAHQTTLQSKADDGSPSGWTPLVPSMRAGLEYFKGNRNDGHYNEAYSELSCQPRILVIVTDGLGNTGTDNDKIDAVVNDLITEGVTIVAVGFGLSNASQLDRIVQRMKTAGEADPDDYLYHLHKEDVNGVAIPFLAQNRQEFINAMNDIVTNVKAQVFHGSSPAPTTSVDNGAILLNASFDASNWTGNITATNFDIFTGQLDATPEWSIKDEMPATINGFIFDSTASGFVSTYTDLSIDGDNFLCKPIGDVINSTPAIIGAPPYYYNFDSYFNFKYNINVRAREELAYVGSNDGALHVFRLSDGSEKWRFYPASVQAKMALAGTSPVDDMCSPSYCHKFLLDGSPEPADIYVNATIGWRTVLTTGLGEGGSAFFALDVTYGEDFDAALVGTLDVKSKFLWEFTETDDAQIGMATSWPTISRVKSLIIGSNGSGWATFFGSGVAATDLLQIDKEAYLFAVNSWDKTEVWIDDASPPLPTYKVKLASGTLKNDQPAPPLVIDTQDDNLSDRIYLGNLYGNMYRLKDIGFGEKPTSEVLFDFEKTDHSTAITAKAGYAYVGNGDIWLYFGTGKYIEQVDKFTPDQQYFLGLFDQGASRATPYKKADLVQMQTQIISAYSLDENGNTVDLNGDSVVDSDDLRQYRTISCPSPDGDGKCNPDNDSWILELAIPVGTGSERVISQPLIVGGIVFFSTFVPDGDVCEGNGETWLFAVDWQTGEFVSNAVFDINGNGDFDSSDKTVQDTNGNSQKIAGVYIGTGKPSGELIIYNDILYVGTTNQPPKPLKVNLPAQRTRLKSWQQQFN